MSKRRYQTTADVEAHAAGRPLPGPPPTPPRTARFRTRGWIIAGCVLGGALMAWGFALALGLR